MPHPMMPESNHDEAAEQQFVVALKSWIFREMEPRVREVTEHLTSEGKSTLQEARPTLREDQTYQNWVSVMRSAQELMWQSAGDCVDRQRDALEKAALDAPDLGSVRLDDDFEPPRYLAVQDTHMMPGGYFYASGENDVRQGAIYDKAANLYSLGRQGGEISDMRGHTIVAHVFERFPDFEPRRILDMGCTIGNSTVAVAGHFPDAEVHAIDIGAGLLRYARARSAHLGAAIHYSQQSAEETDFDDGYFDLVCSSAMLHETSHKGLDRIFAECHRILRPGGIMVHLEVPVRAEDQDLFGMVRADYESRYNNEPFWTGMASTDLAALASKHGFVDVAAGFQDGVTEASRGATGGFNRPNRGPYRSWYMVSGMRGDD